MHDIRYDAVNDEILVANPFSKAVLTFRGGASGEEAPIRVIQGSRTRFGRTTDRLDVDPVHNEIYVVGDKQILVFPREAQGDVAPIRVIRAPDVLSGRSGIAVDPVHDLIIVANAGAKGTARLWSRPWVEYNRRETGAYGGSVGPGSLQTFGRTDNGDVQPRAVIRGPKTGLWAVSQIQVYPPTGRIIVSQVSNQADMEPEEASIGVWNIGDNGDVPPRWKIEGPKSGLVKPRGVAFNPKEKEIYVADMRLNAVLTYYFPEIF